MGRSVAVSKVAMVWRSLRTHPGLESLLEPGRHPGIRMALFELAFTTFQRRGQFTEEPITEESGRIATEEVDRLKDEPQSCSKLNTCHLSQLLEFESTEFRDQERARHE
jgi:hypothetical protein